MAEVHAAVPATADELLRSEPLLAAEVAASTLANVLHWPSLSRSICHRWPYFAYSSSKSRRRSVTSG